MVGGDHCFCLTALSHRSSGRDSCRCCKLKYFILRWRSREAFQQICPYVPPQNQGSFSISKMLCKQKEISNLPVSSWISKCKLGTGKTKLPMDFRTHVMTKFHFHRHWPVNQPNPTTDYRDTLRPMPAFGKKPNKTYFENSKMRKEHTLKIRGKTKERCMHKWSDMLKVTLAEAG